ncbi:hypothetical protein CTI14_44300, partial [Methylobacterium radiotolerans]
MSRKNPVFCASSGLKCNLRSSSWNSTRAGRSPPQGAADQVQALLAALAGVAALEGAGGPGVLAQGPENQVAVAFHA